MKNNIYCIGDSHTSIFSGEDGIINSSNWSIHDKFNIYIKGPDLAYTMLDKLDEINNILKIVPLESYVLLCFGEIDCRAQFIKQSKKIEKNVEDIIIECAERYIEFAKNVQKNGYKIILWGVTPCIVNQPHWYYYEKNLNVFDCPYGSYEERMYCKKLFNNILKEKTKKNNMLYLSIWNKIVSKKNTKKEYFLDDIHLDSKKVLPFIIDEFNNSKL